MAGKNQFNNPGALYPQVHAPIYPQQPQMVPPSHEFQSPPSYKGYPPPTYDQTFPHQPQFQQQQLYVQQQAPHLVTVRVPNSIDADAKTMTCPSCQNLITTRVQREPTAQTHLCAFLVCLLAWPCFWIPYTMDSCKNTTHYCPSCNAYLGSYSP